MARKVLTFGAGLGRSAGEYAADPAAGRDVRNFLVDGNSLRLRQGLESTGWPTPAWGTDVVCLHPFRRSKDWLQVRYDRATRELRVYKINPSQLTAQLVGSWATLSASCSPLPPIIWAAESSGMVFFAHSESNVSLRAATVYYTPGALDTDAGTLTTLTADLDISGAAENLKFAGVMAAGAFLFGWGFGNGTTPNEPAMLRVSYPGKPLTWPVGSFVIIGGDTEPILGMATASDEGVPVIAKANETYVLEGASPATWQPRLLDPHHGIRAPHLITGWAGRVWLWDVQGPHVTDGTAQPTPVDDGLGLRDNPPPDLASLFAETRWGFLVCSDDDDTVYCMFPDATTPATQTAGVALSVRGPQGGQAGWSYVTMPVGVLCAARGPTDKAPPAPVTAYASAVTLTDSGPIGTGAYRRGTLAWTNNDYAGDEGVEIFLKIDGVWTLVATRPITGPTQSYQLDTMQSLSAGTVALRLSRGTIVQAGYTGSNPDTWAGATVAGAKAAYSIGCATPVLNAPVWSRTSSSAQKHALTWTLAALGVGFEVEAAASSGGPWTVVATLAATGDPRNQDVALSGAESNTRRYYRLRASRGGLFSSYATTVNLWAGPSDVAPTFTGLYQLDPNTPGIPRLIAFVQDPPIGFLLDIEQGSTPVAGGLAAAWGYVWQSLTGGYGATSARARFSKTQFGVTDYGPFTAGINITTVNSPAPAPFSGAATPANDGVYTATNYAVNVSYSGPGEALLITYRTPTGRILYAWTSGNVAAESFRGHSVGPASADWGATDDRWVPAETVTVYRVSAGVVLSNPATFEIYKAPLKWHPNNVTMSQPTPGVGTARVTITGYGAYGGTPDWVDVWYRDNTSQFYSWLYAGRITPPGTTFDITGLPLGTPFRVRVAGWRNAQTNYTGPPSQYPFSDYAITLV